MIIGKKGELGEQLIFFAFIFLMAVVGGGIVIGTSIFIGSGYDFREGDANLLGAKIESCVDNGFNLSTIKNPTDMGLLSEKCGLNQNLLESYYKIRICERKAVKNAGECVNSQNPIFTFGNVIPCELTDSNKFLGCSKRATNDYIIITATNQLLRRNAK